MPINEIEVQGTSISLKLWKVGLIRDEKPPALVSPNRELFPTEDKNDG